MHKAWEINNNDTRQSDNLPTYIIFCEDSIHEPAYFEHFSIARKLKVITIPKQGQSHLNFFNTVNHCIKDKRMEIVNGGYKIVDGLMENIWCVYDRDFDVKQKNIKHRDNFYFTNAIKSATDCGLKVAWSNDAFELWVLLHFEKVPTGIAIYHDDINTRLTEVFRNIPNQSAGLNNITSSPDFHYKADLKKRPNFSQHVLPLLNERRSIALNNAIELEVFYAHNIPFHDRNPCTMVHHLVQELLVFHNPA